MDYKDYSQVSEEEHNATVAATATVVDAAKVAPSPSDSALSGQNFPSKFHYVLDEMDKDGMSHIASWQSHGRCFMVHRQEEFVGQVLRRWFNQSKIASFRRQLNIYGFRRITAGPDRGGYYHELFLKGKSFLTRYIPRVFIKGDGAISGRKNTVGTPTTVNFYAMRPLPVSSTPPPPPRRASLLVPSLEPNTSTHDVVSAPHMSRRNDVHVETAAGCHAAAVAMHRDGLPTQHNNTPTAIEILLRQLREDSLSASSSSILVQNVMAIDLRRRQAAAVQSVAAMAAAANKAAVIDSQLLRLQLIRASLNRINNDRHY